MTAMGESSLGMTIRQLLQRMRPEIDVSAVPGDADIREELDLDSMDFLDFVIAVHEATGVDIPEDDYAELGSLDECVTYLEAHGAPISG